MKKVKAKTLEGKLVCGYLIKNPYGKRYVYKENNYFDIVGHMSNGEARCTLDLVEIISDSIEE